MAKLNVKLSTYYGNMVLPKKNARKNTKKGGRK